MGMGYMVDKIVTEYNQLDRIEYHTTVNMAKELAMVERNKKRELKLFIDSYYKEVVV